jgi:SAM-dependent methyltransferase
MVVEHLEDPARAFEEFHRLLRTDGMLVIHTPNLAGYATVAARAVPERVKAPLARVLDGRPAADVFPTLYRANTRKALDASLAQAGFTCASFAYVPSLGILTFSRALVTLELLYIRLTMTRRLAFLRTNILCAYTKRRAVAGTRTPWRNVPSCRSSLRSTSQ